MKNIILPLAACLFALSQVPAQAAKRPNILFMMSDDHASEAISAYGSWLKDYCHTPTLDRLAAEGIRFTNVCCNNSICSPSRASIISASLEPASINRILRSCCRSSRTVSRSPPNDCGGAGGVAFASDGCVAASAPAGGSSGAAFASIREAQGKGLLSKPRRWPRGEAARWFPAVRDMNGVRV